MTTFYPTGLDKNYHIIGIKTKKLTKITECALCVGYQHYAFRSQRKTNERSLVSEESNKTSF